MNKSKLKKIIVILLLVTLLAGIVKWNDMKDWLQAGHMGIQVKSLYELDLMLSGLRMSEDKLQISFNNHDLAYDREKEMYYVTQNIDDDVWDGLFTSSHGKLYWMEDSYFEQYEQAVAEGHAFTLYGIDQGTGSYCTWQIIFTGMPMMVITTNSGEAIGDESQNADVWISNMKFKGEEYQSCGSEVSVRGATSRSYAKQGYKVVLDRKLSLLGMRKDEDWILTALYDDDGLIHNKFSYDVWRNIAASNFVSKDEGTTMEYVELFCNDTYMGVYGLTERIDRAELNLKENDILYKCKGFPELDETNNEDFGLGAVYDIKWPKEYSNDDWIPLKEYWEIFGAENIDYSRARSTLNMENAIDHNIFVLLAAAFDNCKGKNNFYVAEPAGGQYTMIKVPWDCNATWGNGLYAGDINSKLYHPEFAYSVGMWSSDIREMYQIYPSEIKQLTLKRWKELRKNVLSEERLLRMLDEEFYYLHASGAYDRNYVRWNEHGREHWKDEYIYEYVKERLVFLDAYFENPDFPEES